MDANCFSDSSSRVVFVVYPSYVHIPITANILSCFIIYHRFGPSYNKIRLDRRGPGPDVERKSPTPTYFTWSGDPSLTDPLQPYNPNVTSSVINRLLGDSETTCHTSISANLVLCFQYSQGHTLKLSHQQTVDRSTTTQTKKHPPCVGTDVQIFGKRSVRRIGWLHSETWTTESTCNLKSQAAYISRSRAGYSDLYSVAETSSLD